MPEQDTSIDQANQFVPIYWAHFPLEVQVMRTMPSVNSMSTQTALPDRMAKGRELTELGYNVDPAIHVWDGNPWYEMWRRVTYPTAPAFYLNGKPIVASTNPADYPPIIKAPPLPPADTTVVGYNIQPGLWPKDRYTCGVSGDDEFADGAPYEDTRGKFIKRITSNVMGKFQYWEKQ